MPCQNDMIRTLEDKNNTIALSVQYRMNQSIQEVANFMTYDGQLECGNDEVAGKLVQLNPEGNKDIWPECVPESARDAVVAFFDTSQLSDGKNMLKSILLLNILMLSAGA